MREIKVRAWDGSKMHYGGDVVIYLGEAWLEEMSLDAKAIHIKDTEGMIPLQFTGLKDKSGKEIYEGDVVKYIGSNWEVEYSAPEFGLIRKQEGRHGRMDAKYWGSVEIIGNIYENPELLK